MSDLLTGTPPRTPEFAVRSETFAHRMFMPVIMAALNIPTQYTIGTDVSKWNGEMDWAVNYNAGGRFTWARLGSISSGGVLYLDYQWPRNSEIAPTYMFTGGYWYFRPRYDANKQADYVCEHIMGKNLQMPFALDCENNETGMETRYVEKQIEIFLNRYHHNTGKWPIIYTSKGFWSYPNIYAADGRPDWAAERDLWVANYTILANPALPVTWLTKSYSFWQWSADGNLKGEEFGGERPPGARPPSMDINRFPGTYTDLEYYIAEYNNTPLPPTPPTEPPPDPPDPEPTGQTSMVVINDVLNVRSGPGINYPVKDRLKLGDVVEVHDVAGPSAWVQLENGLWVASDHYGKRYLKPQ